MSDQTLTIGRIVHYVVPDGVGFDSHAVGKTLPAIVVGALGTVAHLQVFLDGASKPAGESTHFAPNVPYGPDGAPGSWRWPPRA